MRYVGTTAILHLHPKALAWKCSLPDCQKPCPHPGHGSDDTIGLVDLCTRQDALASIHGVQHVRCGMYGLQAEVLTLLMHFRTAVSSAWSNSEVGRALQIYSLTSASRV